VAALVVDYVRSGLELSAKDRTTYLGVLGLDLVIASFLTFCFILLLHALVLRAEVTYGDRPGEGGT
jgi:hypothetical protein